MEQKQPYAIEIEEGTSCKAQKSERWWKVLVLMCIWMLAQTVVLMWLVVVVIEHTAALVAVEEMMRWQLT